jgi:hypothetical protein
MYCVGTQNRKLSRLDGWPMRSPVNASMKPSRATAHDSGPMWVGRVGSRTCSPQWCRKPPFRRSPPARSMTWCAGHGDERHLQEPSQPTMRGDRQEGEAPPTDRGRLALSVDRLTDVKVRQNERIISVAAAGVNGDGRREVLGLDFGPSEAETFRTGFLCKLRSAACVASSQAGDPMPMRTSRPRSPRCSTRSGSAAACTSCTTSWGMPAATAAARPLRLHADRLRPGRCRSRPRSVAQGRARSPINRVCRTPVTLVRPARRSRGNVVM